MHSFKSNISKPFLSLQTPWVDTLINEPGIRKQSFIVTLQEAWGGTNKLLLLL